ncbi:MAG: hypothetical protein C0501_23365, partial [Isosphaera sp.]|nr:hypothetical protein [Isosphaera sp.]
MGVVYRARHAATGHVVALKVIRGDLGADRVMLDRFLAEARAVAQINHPHVVRLFEYGEHAGTPYFTLEYLPGGTLADRLRNGARLPEREAAVVVMQVAAGVSAAHAQGIVHRDLKPGNVLFDETGKPKVVDFGLAKWAGLDLTRTGATLGTPRYMSPEQAGGSKAVGRAADVWALGVVLYECLTGRRAFDGETVEEVMANVLAARPPEFPPQDPPVPEELRQFCRRCLQKRPEDRYPSAGDLAADLAGYVAGGVDGSAPVRPRRGWRWVERVGIAAGSAAVAALLVVLLRPVPVQPPVPEAAPAAAADSGPTPRLVLHARSGPAGALAFVNANEVVAGYEDGSVRIWDLARGEVAKTLTPRQGGNVWSADLSPEVEVPAADGQQPRRVRYLVTPSDDSQVTVWRLDSYQVYRVFPQPTSTKAAVFSPADANLLATGDRAATVRLWNLDAQIPVELAGHAGTVHALAFSPDGSRLASAGSDGTAKVWDVRAVRWGGLEGPDKPLQQLGEHDGPVYGVAFSPDGS